MTDFNRGSLEAELARLKRFDKKLETLDVRALSPQSFHDFRILQTAIHSELFKFEDMESYTKNPMTYADVIEVSIYVKRNFAPLEQRVKSIIAIEKQAPKVMAASGEPCALFGRTIRRDGYRNGQRGREFLSKDLVEALKEVKDEPLRMEFNSANERAISELKEYAAYLKTEKMPKAHRNYALGREKYQKMLSGGEMIALSPERILEIGLRELRREQEVFADTARKIDPNQKPIVVFKEIQKDHPSETNLIPETKRNLEGIREFLIAHHIVTLPSEVRARVEESPQFMRATSFASMDTPGPFETKATEAYYYVTPTEKDWPAAQKEEWLTAFNYYTTDIVTIHEAYPGHYVQFLALNASPASKLEKVFTSYAFVEGWAHYCERMMLDEGFGANGLRSEADLLRAAKYRRPVG